MKAKIFLLIFVLCEILVLGCGQKITDNPIANQPPETRLTFYPDGSLATTTSRQVLHWWGDDPDGKVVLFLYTWDNNLPVPPGYQSSEGWTITTANLDTFSLKFTNLDTIYTFRISAVDDQGLVDPTPAIQSFPVANSRPEVEFIANTDIPETTFTVASFYWQGTDLDGEETLERYEYVLDDTAAGDWKSISAESTFINLRIPDELSNMKHVFYLRAVDIAGVPSKIIRMPRNDRKIWHVKQPIGKVLIIDDFEVVDQGERLYVQTLDSLGLAYSYWNIKLNRDGDAKYDLMPASVDMFSETMLLFDCVLWYTDSNPHFEEAQITIPRYLKAANKKIIFSTQFKEFFSEQGDPLEFSPVDSLGKISYDVFPGTALQPGMEKSNLPVLKANKWIPFVKELTPKLSSKIVYRLEANPLLWQGQPVVAVVNADNSFYFFGVPFHQLNGNQNARRLLAIILKDEFGLP
ncbi:hypothetical protein L0Z72_00070 [candidate division KSB1 bacterium]|nr:hypothetical protein [candidate division KSB1 bacterium]